MSAAVRRKLVAKPAAVDNRASRAKSKSPCAPPASPCGLRARADRKLPPVTVNVVLVSETDPPPGDEPVEWLLITSLPIDDVAQVRQVIQYYCVRWMIEVFFRVAWHIYCRLSRLISSLCPLCSLWLNSSD